MKNILTLLISFYSFVSFAQPTVTEWELNKFTKRGDKVKHESLPIGFPLKLGDIYSWKSADGMYWDWTYGKLVDINDNKYSLEHYPQSGLKKISKVKFKDLYTVDTIGITKTSKPIDLKMNDYMEKAGYNLQVSAFFLAATIANIVFYPQLVKFQTQDDIAIYNVINSGLIIGTAVSIHSAGLNFKLASKQLK